MNVAGFALSYGYPVVILWLSYGAGLCMYLQFDYLILTEHDVNSQHYKKQQRHFCRCWFFLLISKMHLLFGFIM